MSRHVIFGTNPLDFKLELIFVRIRQAMNSIPKLTLYHVFLKNNYQADNYAKKATLQKKGFIIINNKLYHQPIP